MPSPRKPCPECEQPITAKAVRCRSCLARARTTFEICTIDGCGRGHYAKGWCQMHWIRAHNHGDPHYLTPLDVQRQRQAQSQMRPPWDRFWEKVEVAGPCWHWTGATSSNGYGTFAMDARRGRERHMTAHRAAWELLVGPIPAGYVVDHLCKVPHCVNPDHLEPVSQLENVRRGWRSKRVAASGTRTRRAA
jgi:hypothetical protein